MPKFAVDTTADQQTTCGEALIALLAQYDVDTVFGIPGVHTLDLYRGLHESSIKHVLARNEAGAGFMADGYARVTGKPGVAMVITGPGVTNATTPLGQAYADSIPLLLISSANDSKTLGKGWGCLHETTDQQAITAPLTGFSATAMRPSDVPEMIGQAFTLFASQRPRPVHIAIPTDVLAMPVTEEWQPVSLPSPAKPDELLLDEASVLLAKAKNPIILLGGGAIAAGAVVVELAELLQAPVISSNAGKGIVPDSHPLSLGATIWRQPTLDLLANADVVLALGTELAETDSFVEKLPITGKLIRVDIDAAKLNDLYPATVPILGDALHAAFFLMVMLQERIETPRASVAATVATVKAASLVPSGVEAQHLAVLGAIRDALPTESALFADMSQISYSGCFAYPAEVARSWHYAGGFCTLGCAMPMAIGAKLAQPDLPVVAMAGDGGFMFTVQELMVAVEEQLALPIIVWNNHSLQQIKDDMVLRDIEPIAVDSIRPNFQLLAAACGANSAKPSSLEGLQATIETALQANKPTLIEVNQDSDWLTNL